MRHVYGTSGDRDGAGRSETHLYDISGAQIRENPFRYWEYIPTE